MGVMGSPSTTAVRCDLGYVVQIDNGLAVFRRGSIESQQYATQSYTYQDKTAVMSCVKSFHENLDVSKPNFLSKIHF